MELHNPINAVFHFLCHECHRKYDNNKSETSTEEQKSVKKQAKDEAFYKVEDIINIKGIDVPLYKNENEKTQDFIKKILHLFFKENLLPDIEIENMLNTDYCKNTFGISYSILQSDKTKLHDKTGRSRYWLTERFGKKKYYACSQWWKQNDAIYKQKLSEWIIKIGKINKNGFNQ